MTVDVGCPPLASEAYLDRLRHHLVRLAAGHDPLGHLLAIERLARAARVEWWSAARPGRRDQEW